ncbi:MAG: nucleotide pyrophosphohydrolase [Phycisphaerales bacterium]|nr:nucleotide pyrophosphohydrolase [Phycisphaerales bacterium]
MTPPLTLAQLTELLLKFRRDRDWEQFHTAKDQMLSLTLEAAEVLELAQWREGDALDQHLLQSKEALGDELADVLNWVLLIAHDQKINIADAMVKKIAKNAIKYPIAEAKGRADKYTAYQRETPDAGS